MTPEENAFAWKYILTWDGKGPQVKAKILYDLISQVPREELLQQLAQRGGLLEVSQGR